LNPKSIDKILGVLGAETIPYDLKMECCGYGVRKADEELSLLIVKNKLESIQKTEANCIVVACPACFEQFDFYQRSLNKNNGTGLIYPTFYLSELVALAFGFSYNELGLKFHHTKVKPFLQSIEFLK
jgi:heterodisulfide reductase subunit B